MCLISYKEKKIAEEDITVYKILCKHVNNLVDTIEYHPPFKSRFEYKKGLNSTESEKENVYKNVYKNYARTTVEGGFLHAYTDIRVAFRIMKENFVDVKPFKETYHVFKMVIPKGTEYYEGCVTDICAKVLKWKDMKPCEEPIR